MPDFPLHPTLFISLALLSGFALAPLLAYVDDKSPIKNTTANANRLLTMMWLLAFAFTMALIVIYNAKPVKEAQEMAKALAPFGMMIAAMIASASVMKNIAETKKNEADKHAKEASKFHLDKCTEGLAHFYDLLKDGNNKRVKWIAAARALITTLELSNGITEQHHKDFFELEKSKYRHKLYDLYTNPINGHMITPLFFTGISRWGILNESVADIIEDANNPKKFIITGYDMNDFIDENSIVAIFSILDYPDDFMDNDPLNDPNYSHEKALHDAWTFTEPKKSAYEFIKELYKDQ